MCVRVYTTGGGNSYFQSLGKRWVFESHLLLCCSCRPDWAASSLRPSHLPHPLPTSPPAFCSSITDLSSCFCLHVVLFFCLWTSCLSLVDLNLLRPEFSVSSFHLHPLPHFVLLLSLCSRDSVNVPQVFHVSINGTNHRHSLYSGVILTCFFAPAPIPPVSKAAIP